MGKGIKIFKPEIVNDVKQGNCNRYTGDRMNVKRYSAESLPGRLVKWGSYGISIIRVGRDKGTDKRQDHHEMTEVTYEGIDHDIKGVIIKL